MSRKELKIEKNGEVLIITRSGSETNGEITEFEGIDQPGIGPPRHIHFLQEEKVKVKKGRLRVKGPSGEFVLSEGEEAVFPAGEPHEFWNDGDMPVHYSGYLKPSCNWEYIIENVYRSANEAGDVKPGPFDAAFLLIRYKTEIDLLVIPKPVKLLVFPVLYIIGKLTGRHARYKDAPVPYK